MHSITTNKRASSWRIGITGSSSGMGAVIAKKLAADSFVVIVNYAGSKERGNKVVSEIETNGGK